MLERMLLFDQIDFPGSPHVSPECRARHGDYRSKFPARTDLETPKSSSDNDVDSGKPSTPNAVPTTS
jgi:hypothetical protein